MARTIYGLDDDGNEVSTTVSDDCKVFISGIPTEQEHTLELTNVNNEVETYEVDGVIIRPNRPPR